MGVLVIPFLASFVDYWAELHWFGDFAGIFMVLFGVLMWLHYIFIGPTIKEMEEYQQTKALQTGKPRRVPIEVSAKTRNAITGLLALPVLISLLNIFAMQNWFGDYYTEPLAISLAFLVLARVYTKPRIPESEDE